MRKAHTVTIAACLAVAPCAAAQDGGSGDDISLAYRAEAIADQQRRTQQQQATDGPRLYGGIQTWYVANWRNDPPDDDEAITLGFVMRRVKLGVEDRSGDIQYRVQGAFSRSSDEFFLEDAWVANEQGNFLIRVGQFKPPFLYEENVEWYDQLAAERSNATTFLTQGYTQGIEFQYDTTTDFRSKFAVGDGIRTPNFDYDQANEADIAFTGRLDYMLRGGWDTVTDFTSEFGGPEAWRIGIAGHYQFAGRTGSATGLTQRTNVTGATADIQWERNGLSLYGAGIIFHVDAKDSGFEVLDYALVAQAGYRYDPRNEVFGRVDVIFADDRPISPSDDPLIVTTGYNHYFDGASARFTADVMFLTTETRSTLLPRNTAQGYLADGGSPQIVLRLALQFLF